MKKRIALKIDSAPLEIQAIINRGGKTMETTSIMTVQITVIAEDKDGAMALPFGAANKKELAAEIKKLLDCDFGDLLTKWCFWEAKPPESTIEYSSC